MATGIAGKQAGLYIGSTPVRVAWVNDVSLKVDNKTIDTTNFDSNEWDECILSTKSWSLDFTANFKPSDAAQMAVMNNIINASQAAQAIEFRLTNVATPPKYTGDAITSSLSIDTSVSDKITIKATLTGSGALAFSAGS
jgi:predicted secreted protein